MADTTEAEQAEASKALEARTWIEAVLSISLEERALHEALKDGVLLCELANAIQPGLCPKPSSSNKPFKQMENIAAYCDACKQLGMRQSELFQTVELFEGKNMRAIITNIHALGRIAQQVEGFTGPSLGPKMATAQPRHFSEEQLHRARAVPTFLSQGSNPCAQRSSRDDTARGIVRGESPRESPPDASRATNPRAKSLATEAEGEAVDEAELAMARLRADAEARRLAKAEAKANAERARATAAGARAAETEGTRAAEAAVEKKRAAASEAGAIASEDGKAQEARAWIEAVLGTSLDGRSLHVALKDGVLLCELANAVKPGICPTPSPSARPFKQMENITAYLSACASLGARQFDLFQTTDLFEAKNMRAVVASIQALGRIAQQTAGYTGPQINPGQAAAAPSAIAGAHVTRSSGSAASLGAAKEELERQMERAHQTQLATEKAAEEEAAAAAAVVEEAAAAAAAARAHEAAMKEMATAKEAQAKAEAAEAAAHRATEDRVARCGADCH